MSPKTPSASSSVPHEWTVCLEGYLDYMQAECGLALNTRKAYGRDLRRFMSNLEATGLRDLKDLSPRDI